MECPYCGAKNNAPETATTCQNCGKRFYTSGIEVESKESTKLYEEIKKKRRKKETEADKEMVLWRLRTDLMSNHLGKKEPNLNPFILT